VALLGVALALICWPVWWIAGILAGWAGLGDLDRSRRRDLRVADAGRNAVREVGGDVILIQGES
jgi:hypothetical protein